MKNWNVLIYPGGNEIGIEIAKSLKYSKETKLFSISNGDANHALYLYTNHFILPDITSKDWVPSLNECIRNNDIDFIYPAHAYVIDALVNHRKAIACPIVLADSNVIEITRSKEKTLSLFSKKIPIPKTYLPHECIGNFPLHVKPERAYGGQGIQIVYNQSELDTYLARHPNTLIQEYLPGKEFTVDCFSDHHGILRFCSARSRDRIRMGTSMHCELPPSSVQSNLKQYADIIAQELKITGAWFFQVKMDIEGTLKLLEVEARIAGTMALNRVRGVNFPLLSLYQAAGLPVKISCNEYDVSIDRSLQNRYLHNVNYKYVYVDLDDTLLIKNKINIDLIRFLYQCLNRQIKITLLSKSLATDKIELLKKFRIENLFDEIIWLKETDNKADYIKNNPAIFIDDSFSQRLTVQEQCKIATFDCSMIEMLMDERI